MHHAHRARGANHVGRICGRLLMGALLVALALVFIVPLWWTLASALRPAGSLYEYANPLTWRTFFPSEVTMDNIINIFTNLGFGRALANSFIVAFGAIAMGVVVSAMAGFALAKFVFPGKSVFFFIVLLTFMVPFEAIVIPLHLVVKRIGIVNTYWALILPAVETGSASSCSNSSSRNSRLSCLRRPEWMGRRGFRSSPE